MEADLAFHWSRWFVPVSRTLSCFQDWTVAMAHHGVVYLTERHTVNATAVAECNQRPSNMQRRCSRMLVKYGLTAAVGSKSPTADLYYAAVAVLIDAGKVAKWVRRRDLRKGYYSKEKCVEPFRDPYWQIKLKCICLWVHAPDAGATMARLRPIDPHSGLPLELQLEVFRRTRAAGADSMPMPDWAVHRGHGVLEDVAEKLRHANPPITTKPQAQIVILVDIATGRMTTDGAIPDDRALQSMRHGSSAVPPHVGGLSPEQCGVLAVPRDGGPACGGSGRSVSTTPRRATRSAVPSSRKRRRTGAGAALEGRRPHAHRRSDGVHMHHGPR